MPRTGPCIAPRLMEGADFTSTILLEKRANGRMVAQSDGSTEKRTPPRGLLDGDGFCEVARLIHVAAPPHRYVIGQQLQRDYFQERHEQLGSGRKLDEMVGRFAGEIIAGGDNSNDDTVAGFHLF